MVAKPKTRPLITDVRGEYSRRLTYKNSSTPVAAVTITLKSMPVCTTPQNGTTMPSHTRGIVNSDVGRPLWQ